MGKAQEPTSTYQRLDLLELTFEGTAGAARVAAAARHVPSRIPCLSCSHADLIETTLASHYLHRAWAAASAQQLHPHGRQAWKGVWKDGRCTKMREPRARMGSSRPRLVACPHRNMRPSRRSSTFGAQAVPAPVHAMLRVSRARRSLRALRSIRATLVSPGSLVLLSYCLGREPLFHPSFRQIRPDRGRLRIVRLADHDGSHGLGFSRSRTAWKVVAGPAVLALRRMRNQMSALAEGRLPWNFSRERQSEDRLLHVWRFRLISVSFLCRIRKLQSMCRIHRSSPRAAKEGGPLRNPPVRTALCRSL